MVYSHQIFTALLFLAMAVSGYAQDATTVPSVTTVAPTVTFVQTIPVIAIPGLSTTITQSNSAGPLVPISDITSIPVDTSKLSRPSTPTDARKTTDSAVTTSTAQRILTTMQPTPAPLTDKTTSNTPSHTSNEPESGTSTTASSTAATTFSASETVTPTPDKKNDKRILLGSVIGGIALVAIVATVLMIYKREKKAQPIKNTKGKGRATSPGNTSTLEQTNPRYSLAYGKAKLLSWMSKIEDPKRHGNDLERGFFTKTSHKAGKFLSNSISETPLEYYPRANSIPPNSPLNTLSTQSTFAPYSTSPTTLHASPPLPEQKTRENGIDLHSPKRPTRPQSLTPDLIELLDRIPSPISVPFSDEIRDSVSGLTSPQIRTERSPTTSLQAQILNTRAYQNPTTYTPYNSYPDPTRPESRSCTGSPEPARSERTLSPEPLQIIKSYKDRNSTDPTPRLSKATRSGGPNFLALPKQPRIRDSENIDPDRRDSYINHAMDALEGRPPRSRMANRHQYPASSVYSRQLDGITLVPQRYRGIPISGEHTEAERWAPNENGKQI